MSNTSQARSCQSLSKDTFSAILSLVEHSQAQGSSLPVGGPKAGRAASPAESIAPLQDSASQASLSPFSAKGTGRSDLGRLIDVNSDQRLSAANSSPPTAEDRGAERAQRDETSNQLSRLTQRSRSKTARVEPQPP